MEIPKPLQIYKVLYLYREIAHRSSDHTLLTIDQQKNKEPNRKLKEHMRPQRETNAKMNKIKQKEKIELNLLKQRNWSINLEDLVVRILQVVSDFQTDDHMIKYLREKERKLLKDILERLSPFKYYILYEISIYN